MLSRYEHGRIIAVNEVRFGSNLNGDHASGVTSLTVEDAADFDETGGQLTINGQVIAYTGFDDDTGTITLSAPLAAAAEDGDRVDTWDPLYGAASAEKVAQVQLDGEDDTNTDPLEATIALHLQDELGEGLRGLTGESVLLEVDGDEWRVVDVLARSQSAGVKFYDQDTLTAPADGAQSLALTYTPIDGSVHMAWGGLWQPHTEFTVTGKVITVPDPAGLILAGDVLDFRYAYRDATVAPAATSPSPVPYLWWKFNETAGTTAADASGNAINGTLAGAVTLNQSPVFASGGTSFAFAGGVVSATFPSTLDTYTIIADINPTSVSGVTCISALNMFFGLNAGKLWASRTFAGAVGGTTALSAGTSYRVAVVIIDKLHTSLYVNGALDASGDSSGSGTWTFAAFGGLTVGRGGDGLNAWPGRIDNYRIFNTALSADDIAADYAGR